VTKRITVGETTATEEFLSSGESSVVGGVYGSSWELSYPQGVRAPKEKKHGLCGCAWGTLNKKRGKDKGPSFVYQDTDEREAISSKTLRRHWSSGRAVTIHKKTVRGLTLERLTGRKE